MMIAARNAFLMGGAGPTPWVNPYVTDGLVALWDGEWNAGGGVHDANATTWADLSGNNHDAALTAVSFGAEFGLFNGSTSVGVMDVAPSPTMTIEAVISDFVNHNNAIVILGGNPVTYGLALGVTEGAGVFAYCVVNNGQSLPAAKVNQFVSGSYSAIYTQVGVVSGSLNGVAASTHMSYLRWNTTQGGIGYRIDNAAWAFEGKIHNIRVYSRALTSAEVAANYAIDAARFGL